MRQRLQDWEKRLFHLIHRNQHRMSGKLKKQRNMFQIKGQDKNFRKILNEKEINDLHDKKFKISNKYAHQRQKKT